MMHGYLWENGHVNEAAELPWPLGLSGRCRHSAISQSMLSFTRWPSLAVSGCCCPPSLQAVHGALSRRGQQWRRSQRRPPGSDALA